MAVTAFSEVIQELAMMLTDVQDSRTSYLISEILEHLSRAAKVPPDTAERAAEVQSAVNKLEYLKTLSTIPPDKRVALANVSALLV